MIQLLLVLTSAWLSPSLKGNSPALGGGHDTFGYTYLDSDTPSAPGAPVYSWIDISTVGTQVSGLADDNVVGPFPIGFSFPYYWYTVNSIYIGSNGYITFGDNYLAASPFPEVPSPARPNNTVAPFMSDLIFNDSASNHGKVFYWTNPANDTFIVEYDSARFWSTVGANTFEVILSRPDSTLTFQYKLQRGTPYNGWAPGDMSVGIENVTGSVGIPYLYGNIPSTNMIHDTLAVRFTPPESTTYHVHDAMVWRVMNDENGGFFVLRGDTEGLWAKVRNAGNQSEAGYPVYCIIRNSSNSVVYADTVTTPSELPNQIDSLVFSPAWVPTTNGQYTMKVITNLPGDMFRSDDTLLAEVHVVTYPAELSYDNGTASNGTYWNGNMGGFGNRFVAPKYPVEVTAINANLSNSQTYAAGCTLYLFASDGPGGSPGKVLASDTFDVPGSSVAAWYQYTLATPVKIADDSAFFVGVTSNALNAPNYSVDDTPPFSNQGWEFTGGWSPSRSNSTEDVMMHALVQSSLGIEEELSPTPTAVAMTAKPNPFGHTTQIQFGRDIVKPEQLEIYNMSGALVRTLKASGTYALWDGRSNRGTRAAEGVYIARLVQSDAPMLKVVLTQ